LANQECQVAGEPHAAHELPATGGLAKGLFRIVACVSVVINACTLRIRTKPKSQTRASTTWNISRPADDQ
jgi:hypothetical protein